MRRLFVAVLFVAGCTKSAPSAPEAAAPVGQAAQAAPAAAASPSSAVSEVAIDPAAPLTGQALTAKVVDPQDRALSFAWLVDGNVVSGESTDHLEGSYVKKGGTIEVRVVPVTDAGEGESKTSAAVKVGNSPPRIDALDFVSSDNGTVIMQARAEDPDGDALKYRVVSGPPGLTVDGAGRVRWPLPANFASAVSFVVGASDGADEATLQGDIGQH